MQTAQLKQSIAKHTIKLIKAPTFIFLVMGLNACVQKPNKTPDQLAAKVDTVVVNKKAAIWVDSGYQFLYKAGSPKKLDTAIQYFERAIAIDSSRFLPFQLIVTALEMQGNLQLAIKPLTRWIDFHPDDLEVTLNRGLLYEKLDNITAANQDFARVGHLLEDRKINITSELSPKDQALLIFYAKTYFLIGKKESGIALLKELENTFPNTPKFKEALAAIDSQNRNIVVNTLWHAK